MNYAGTTRINFVVNELVKKFASQGTKGDYGSPPFEHIHLKINHADRAAIYPQSMRTHFENLLFSKFPPLAMAFVTLNDDIANTKHFWIGTSADRMRHNFDRKVSAEFIRLEDILHKIYDHGIHWIDETIKFEASLATP